MVNRRYDEWERDTEVYTPAQIEAIARYCGLNIDAETNTHLIAYCPFHNNTDDPAFALDKSKGLWTCFNPSCAESGNIQKLLSSLKGLNFFEATRIILKYKDEVHVSLEDRIAAVKEEVPDFVEFPSEPLKRMAADMWEHERPQQYLHNRRFTDDTIKHFEMGYSAKKDMIIVPMHDPDGMPVGMIGRSIEGKVFKNSTNLPKSKTVWNFHRAKKTGDTIILNEASFDSGRVHQSGYPNVGALLGGHFTAYHREQINRNFSTIIIMTDYDKKIYRPNCRVCSAFRECQGHRPGRDLGRSIASQLPHKKILWAAYDDHCVYPHGAKDVGDMTDDEIRQCLRNAITNFEYTRWDIESREDVLAS